MEPDSEALQGDASASLPPETEGYPAAAPSDAAAEREPRPNRAVGLPYEIIASELAERQQQPAPRGKRSVKSEDADDEPYYPGSSKRSKVAVDSVEPQDLAGNVFLRVDALHPNALVTFDGDLARPLFFEERESGAVEIPGALLGEGVDAMALKMPGVEVELPGGTRRTATVSELINYLKLTEKPTKVGPYMIPKGVMVFPCLYVINNWSGNWEEPRRFKPERWLVSPGDPDPAIDQKTGAPRFLPFSSGPKACIGGALGLVAVRTAAAALLSTFTYRLAERMGTPASIKGRTKLALTLKVEGGMWLRCARRVKA
ncbi:hypothetical protein MNEG_2236 [Monoraphidium neglectum]|uniref:Cytochrome P450 n=1 Tax=Monoraphidium neglectum TaxID=145388 RepID=A0A0D2K5U5_9CHLO|nr:hypothetical protein MNEG_2236 [Monoraphidium neglectum]KIZ05718.1 hypothetical protein MNEG_2236 [Monoraphidium neglectum]|eukprot:XP_013904737.1 hypothetical protein MNEG_2236 [Monoraphidium neglectum]